MRGMARSGILASLLIPTAIAVRLQALSKENDPMGILGRMLSFIVVVVAFTPAVCAADADKLWPVRPVRVIVPFAHWSPTEKRASGSD